MKNQFLSKGVYLAVAALVVFLLRDRLGDVLGSYDRLSQVKPWAFALMAVFEFLSFGCIWLMFKLVLPEASWRGIIKSQLVSNAASRVIPGGAATGGAVQFSILKSAGVDKAAAGGSLAATSVVTFLGLFTIPVAAGLFAIVTAPLEGGLLWGAIAGVALLAVTLLFSTAVVKVDGVLDTINRLVEFLGRAQAGWFNKEWVANPNRLTDERDRILESLRGKWLALSAAAVGKWFFDFLVLLTVVSTLDNEVSFALLLLAYAAASTLVMIPITPGGFGLVEVGLTSLLVTAGLLSADADLAVFVYRLFSFWFPILAGGLALMIPIRSVEH